MQGQRGSVESLPETLEFDHRTSSSTASMDHNIFWSGMLLHPAESQNFPNCLLSPSDTNMSFANHSTEDSSSLSVWNSAGPSSAGHSDAENHDETTMELGWPSSPIASGSVDADNMISLEDTDINLNSAQMDDEQPFSFSLNSNLDDVSHDLEHRPFHAGDEASQSTLFSHPYVPSFLESEQSSSHAQGNPSGTTGFMSGDYDDRPGSSLDGRRLACKRKNIEGLTGQSSASGTANFFNTNESNTVHSGSARSNSSARLSTPSSYMPVASSFVEQPNPRFNTIPREAALSGQPEASVAGSPESPQRSFRLRMNPSRQQDVYPRNLSSSRDNTRNSSIWSPNEPFSNPILFNQRPESRPVSVSLSPQNPNQPQMSVVPGLPRQANFYPWTGASAQRNGSSSSSTNSVETLAAIREGTLLRHTPRNEVPVQPLFVPTPEIRNAAHDSANWSIANGSPSAEAAGPGSRAGTNSAMHSSLGSTLMPHHNSHAQFSRGLAEAVRRTLLASVGSESRRQNSNVLSQQSSHPSSSHEVGHQSGSVSRGNQRQALLLERQSDGIPASMRSLAAREGRSRMISEIRNALDLMRRGENLRFEDVFMLDHPVFHGAADLHDRHRDMRLDVDSMSYEELLALEERIGNVSTGLAEETVLEHLKQRKHFASRIGLAAETEPCCICQEEYVEGEDLGILKCGHDFHTSCIKQWLMCKNLCPICKTTALVT